nr:immunoglobulin light chain junction region [Macaca mulatta]MOV83657.1 immunoglobulin light chain junction region [Macaca mulatta]
CLQGYSVPFTF